MTEDAPQRLAMSEFDYDLPEELIAQVPLVDRAASRLLHVDRASGAVDDQTFRDLPSLLNPGDLLVLNDSRVISARIIAHRQTGGQVEVFLLRKRKDGAWLALVRPAKRLVPGEQVTVRSRTRPEAVAMVQIIDKGSDGQAIVRLDPVIETRLDDFGRVPLPPYIHEVLDEEDRYQTVYSREPGSAAAPTAGLHFTPDVFATLRTRQIDVAYVTLHVGLDTFRPVTAEYADQHIIHQEWYTVPVVTVEAIQRTRERGGRVVAVGTTTARSLESFGRAPVREREFSGMTAIYITPGFEWRVVDAMVTNFHLPRSTLLLMMSSFTGKDLLFYAYRHAISQRYRFFSFGDAMLIT